MRSKQIENKELSSSAVDSLLKRYILNSENHIFGNYSKCSDFFEKGKLTNKIVLAFPEHDDCTENETIMNVIEEEILFWKEGNSAKEIKKFRFGKSFDFQDIEKFIIG